jgi:hypothetical protein
MVAPAPSTPIAKAARAFGDEYPQISGHWRMRAVGLLYVFAALVYVPWLIGALNGDLPFLSWPFAAANVVTVGATLLNILSQWSRAVPEPRPVALGDEPTVGVIVPTCREPVPMILRTLESIFEQDWLEDRLVVVLSDDGHDPELEAAARAYPVVYHSPPPRLAPGRDGAAKRIQRLLRLSPLRAARAARG